MSWQGVGRCSLLRKYATCPGCVAPPAVLAAPPKAPAPNMTVKQMPPVGAAEPAKPPVIPKMAFMNEHIDFSELGRQMGETVLEKTSEEVLVKVGDAMPATDIADMDNVKIVENMKTRGLQDTVIHHPDGTVSVKPNGGTLSQEALGTKSEGILSKIKGKHVALAGLGALALGGLAYGLGRSNQNNQQSPQIGSGAYQARYGY